MGNVDWIYKATPNVDGASTRHVNVDWVSTRLHFYKAIRNVDGVSTRHVNVDWVSTRLH